ncbi:Alpha/Beta hydrolase protein [Syncephalastrum racemosum]|uniref:Alpha/Beta hydrolase protein n=1 Tax=Syncephalastrum racemosum TaxID=13706 RepID=A0A1X2HV87_SYNRA|nr:Alpha/Beta hydrolase protein [Syncephalastrum racemosum]
MSSNSAAVKKSSLGHLPGKWNIFFGILCAVFGTTAGRKLAAHILIGGLRRTLLRLPLALRSGLVKRILGLQSERRARKIMYQMTHPYGYQWDWITPVTTKNGARGYWIGKGIKENGGTPYAEETAKDLDLVFYYVHGGAFRMGHALMYMASFTTILEQLQKEHGIRARIFSIEYGLSPEVTWPQPREQCEEAYRYLVQDLGIPNSKIVMGGDSAGGNLTAVTLLSLRKQLRQDNVVSFSSLPRLPLGLPAAAVLISPWVMLDATAPSYDTNFTKDCLPLLKGVRPSWYFSSFDKMSPEEQAAVLQDPDVSPLLANLEGLCPTLVAYGNHEVFQSDIESFIARLQRDKVHVDIIARNAPHVWIIEPTLAPSINMYAQGIAELSNWLARAVERK